MCLAGCQALFLALDIEGILRDAPAWATISGCVLLVLVLFSVFYLSTRLSDIKKAHEAAVAERKLSHREHEHGSKEEERKKKLARRQEIISKIPSGPVGTHKLPAATLQVRNRTEDLPSNKEVTIGKLPDNNLAIPELGVSKRHAKIRPGKTGYILYDMASSNGTFVNGDRTMKHILHDGDKIGIGPETLIFRIKKPDD